MKYIYLIFVALFAFSSFSQGFKDIGKSQYKNVFALIIGVSEYDEAPKLTYADKDAQIIHELLEKTFPEQKKNLTLLVNEEASQLNIINGIRDLVVNAKEGDLVIFYFSGHGDVVDDIIDGEQGFFLAHDASKSRIYYPSGGAVEFSYVNKALTRITDKNAEVWMITDACKSGKIINTDGAANTMASLNNGFTKTTKFISCGANELSYEDKELEQGVFTYFLVRALAGGADSEDSPGLLSVDEINSYMKTQVRKFTGSMQTPKVSASDDFTNIISTNESFSSLIKDIPEGSRMDNLVASRGSKGDGEVKSKELSSFEQLIIDGDLHGKTRFAYEVFKSNSLNASSSDLKLMERLLVEALLDRGQRNTNLFLSGRPMIGSNEDFSTTKVDYEIASELLGKDHPMYEQVDARSQFFAAMELIQSNSDLVKAETTLNALVLKYPKAAHLNQGLAILYIQKSEKSKAEEQLSEASKKVSTWSKPKNSSAYLSIIEGKLNEASKKISESEKLDKDKDNIYLLKAYLHSSGYELQNAEKALKSIKNEEGNLSESELSAIEAKINELRGRITVAQSMYQRSLDSDKDNMDLLLKMGNLYKQERDTSMALSFFKRANNLNPNSQSAKANIALLQNKEISLDESLIDASDVNEVLLAADVLADKKEYSKAVELLERSIKVVNWNPELYYELGKMQYSNGQETESMASIKKAIEISPYHYKSIRSLAYMYLHEKKFKEADALIKKHDPFFKESAKYLALSYQVYRQIDSKRDLYPLLERAIQLDSLETDAYKALYQLHIEDNRYTEALREFNNLIVIGGGRKDSVDFYNRVENQVKYMIDLHIYEGQKEGLKIILDQDPYNFEMAYFMGMVLYMEGEYDAANKQLRIFSKSIQSFSPGVQKSYYNLKAKINLETDHPDLAFRLFGMSSGGNDVPDYLGLAMAQFELGQEWQTNFRRAKEPLDYNEDAIKRYNKMSKKSGGSGYSGGAERNGR